MKYTSPLNIQILEDPVALGKSAASQAILFIKEALNHQTFVNIILATGASQFEMLKQLVLAKDIDWSRIRLFHLDEYIGLSEDHPASFRKYLKERFVAHIPPLKGAFFIDGNAADLREECNRLNDLIRQFPIDVAMVGIGENGHLAFNDPPADFDTEAPFLIVELDEDCRKQQMGEGWFPDLESVPQKAISMSIRQILKSKKIICSVPDNRKAKAVKASVEGPVTNLVPASILQDHPNTFLYLDQESAKELKRS